MSDLLTTLALVAVTISVVTDLQERRISNRLLAAVLLAAVTVRVYYDDELLSSSVRLLTVAALLLPAFILRGMGAGDVKLLAVLAFCLDEVNTEIMIMITLLTGGVWGLGLLVWHKLHHTQSAGIAYAIPIMIGTVIAIM